MPADFVSLPARKLNLFAEPVSEADLSVGETYYSVTFVDGDARVPILEPVVYLGKDLEPDCPGCFHFQDAGSHLSGIGNMETVHRTFEGESVKHIFSLEKGVDVLQRCLLRQSDDPHEK